MNHRFNCYNKSTLALAGASLLSGYVLECNRRIVRKEYTINQNKTNGSFKILYMSDIHYGCCHDKRMISKKLEQLESEEFDLILLGGDIVQYPITTKAEVKEIFSKLSKLNSKYGIYFTYGNHDYSNDGAIFDKRKHSDYYSWEDLVYAINDNDIQILSDELIKLPNNVTLLGRADYSNIKDGRSNISDFKLDKDSFIICADHYPIDMINCATSGVDLQLSGHTHGGQIFPINLVIPIVWKYPVYGRHRYGDMDLIVSSGMGIGAYGLRVVHHCEYVVINCNNY